MTTQTTTPTTTDRGETTPIRAIIIVAYFHAETGNDRIMEARRIMVDALVEDGPDWVDDGMQMLTSQIVPLDADEAIEYYVDDLDDLDDDEAWDLDDFRDHGKHGSTPR
jgi:hypothetical protein